MAFLDISSSIRNYASSQGDINENLYEVKDKLGEVKYNIDESKRFSKKAKGDRLSRRALDMMYWMDENNMRATNQQQWAIHALNNIEGWYGAAEFDWGKTLGIPSPKDASPKDVPIIKSPKESTLGSAYKSKDRIIPKIVGKIGSKYNKGWSRPEKTGWKLDELWKGDM